MEKCDLRIGHIVQIKPEHDEMFGGCLMVVTEPKPWGAQGYCKDTGNVGLAFYRCKFEDMELVGCAKWVRE